MDSEPEHPRDDEDTSEYERFELLARRLVSVCKDEIAAARERGKSEQDRSNAKS